MPVTPAELDSFYRFASEKLASGESSLGWDDLFRLWNATTHRDTANRQGFGEVGRGGYESTERVMDELRGEFELPE